MARKPAEAKEEAAEGERRKRRKRTPDGPWRPTPLPWILGAGRSCLVVAEPVRILSATLPEAFLLAASLKDAEVVAFDHSARRVRAAKTAATRRRLRNLRIEYAQIDQPALGELIGGNFNAVIAHDVLHQAGNIDGAWGNLSAACAPDGSLYVMLRGSAHPAGRIDAALASFGLDRASPDAPQVHSLLAAIGGFACASPEDLAAEFGPSGAGAFSASDWVDQAARAGLHLRATTLTSRYLTRALAGGGTGLLAAFSLPALASLLDSYLQPASFEMVFTREVPAEPPWREPGALLDWTPVGRFLPLFKLQPLGEPWDALATVEVEIHGVLEPQSFTLSRYMLELLRLSDGRATLREIIAAIPHETGAETLVGGLHFLHHAFILELLPPAHS